MQEDAGRMSGTLHLAQALSNRGRRGRKNDFRDAERLLKRLVSQELILSFVPDGEQRLWRTVTRTKYQLRRDRVRLQNQLEALLEEAHITLSSLVSDLLGASARRMLQALADGETDAQALAALADRHLQATPEQLRDALGACSELCLSKTSKCLSGRHLYCFRKPFSHAHFSHDTPRCSACYLPLARCPRTRETGLAPSNRRAAAVGNKTPEITAGDRLLWIGLSRIWRDVTGARCWPSFSPRRWWPGIVPDFACSGPGRCAAANRDGRSFPARSET